MHPRPLTARDRQWLALVLVLVLVLGAVAQSFAPSLAPSGEADAAPLRHGLEGSVLVLPRPRPPQTNPLAGRSMWIWELHRTKHGWLHPIANSALAHGISTVFIKGGDGRDRWHQLNRRLVRVLRGRGVGVCGWQYVYGTHPVQEARVGARIVKTGVDCLIVDAEAEYEGRAHSARRYIRSLRHRIGRRYPVALTTFPYASLHERFPYRQFLGPGGAQYNLPQVYWRELGDSPKRALKRTLRENRRFGRPILPAGQSYHSPTARQVRRFEVVSRRLGAAGVSYWVWQHTARRVWRTLRSSGGYALAPRSIRRRLGSAPRNGL